MHPVNWVFSGVNLGLFAVLCRAPWRNPWLRPWPPPGWPPLLADAAQRAFWVWLVACGINLGAVAWAVWFC